MAVAAGTQNAINIAVALGVLPRKAPCTIVNVRLPAPSREEAAALYVDSATAAPEGLYEGAAQVDVENTQLGAVHAVQVAPPSELATAPEAAQMAIWERGQEFMPASEDEPAGHAFWYCELVPAGQK